MALALARRAGAAAVSPLPLLRFAGRPAGLWSMPTVAPGRALATAAAPSKKTAAPTSAIKETATRETGKAALAAAAAAVGTPAAPIEGARMAPYAAALCHNLCLTLSGALAH